MMRDKLDNIEFAFEAKGVFPGDHQAVSRSGRRFVPVMMNFYPLLRPYIL